jgi:hypothetical protein
MFYMACPNSHIQFAPRLRLVVQTVPNKWRAEEFSLA